MNQPRLKECFADNGEHSHWELIDSDTGEVLWTEDSFNPKDYDCLAGACPALDDPDCEDCSLKRLKKGNSKEYLLCAAIRRVEERDCPKVYWEQFHDIYKIELGWRHPDIMHRFGKEVSRNPNDQGFYTSKGRFVTREEGLEIARAAGQVDKIIGGVSQRK